MAEVRIGPGFRVKTFEDLVVKIASLSFFNPGLELLYRGQSSDYHNQARRTTLLPSIFRANGYFTKQLATSRFNTLEAAESELCKGKAIKGIARIRRYRVLQWAIIQHYEICATPLLDVTHSLRVACSFATLANPSKDSFVFVLGLPYLGGCISTSGDQGLQSLRMTSVCPPKAKRPHFQEGYLFGDYPDASFAANQQYQKEQWDCARRLICKFVLPPAAKFWGASFAPIPRTALFPPKDEFEQFAHDVRQAI